MKASKLLLLVVIVTLAALFFAFDLGQYLSLEYLKSQQQQLDSWYRENPALLIGGYFLVYVLVTGLSLPGAAVLTLVGGAIFGLVTGVIVISFASTIGATLAFLVARFLLHDTVQKKFGHRLKAFNAGVKKDGAFYLFALRLVPAFPFFMINLLMGLTPIRTWTYYWVSQVGMFAGTIVYVYAGTQLGQIESLSGILSPQLLFAFALLGLFPLIARKILDAIKARRVYQDWSKPKRFETNMVVIGAGAAGLVSAYIAAAIKAKVTLIEKHQMGGDCLNTGCVPSKALIRSAKFLSHIKRSKEFGIRQADVEFDFSDVMERVHQTIKHVEPHDSVERYTELGVDCIQGDATITSPWTVQVNGKDIHTRSIIIAAGAEPFVPDIEGVRDVDYYTSDTIWGLKELPERLLIIGGGPIGCELAQSFQRLGSQIIQLQRGPRLMPREDSDVSEIITQRFIDEGIDVRTGHTPLMFENHSLLCQHNNAEVSIEFDALLFAVGRSARTSGYGLDNLGIDLNDKRTIDTNEFLQTKYPNIYACGDVAGPYQFTHTAAHQAWYASVNALLGLKKFKVDYSVIPWCTFTDPEVARVGLNEQEAQQQNIEYELTTYGMDDLDRAI
ncbi:MAG: FAD-dependent oxidoreductase, partial [Gammaproteobacteria bacterium]|nr:FAD-dependent oxidoreductase [Gammaproteobacteria bacterium]